MTAKRDGGATSGGSYRAAIGSRALRHVIFVEGYRRSRPLNSPCAVPGRGDGDVGTANNAKVLRRRGTPAVGKGPDPAHVYSGVERSRRAGFIHI